MDSVNLLCTRAALLVNGELKKIGNTREVINEYVSGNAEAAPDLKNEKNAIWGARLLNDKGEVCNIVKPNQHLTLEFKLLCEEPLSDCVLGFVIFRVSDGLLLCDYNMPLNYDGAELNREMQGKVQFDANLLRGAYAFTLVLHHCPSAKNLFYAKNITYFSVEERFSRTGMVYLQPNLQITTANELSSSVYVNTTHHDQ